MVVVLPLVPVTPSTRIDADGWSNSVAATGPSAARTLGTCACGDLERQRTFDEQRHRTPGHRVGGVLVAVGDGTGDAREARPRARLAAVVGDRGDLEVGIAGPNDLVPDPVETGEQVVPTHARASSPVGHGIGHRRVPGTGCGIRDDTRRSRPVHEVGTRS